MYSVSAEFLTAMNAPVQEHKVKGTIGATTFGPGNILSGSFFVTNQCSENNMLGIGQVYIGELGATFRNVGISDGAWVGQTITPVFSLKTENGWEDVPLGVYTIAEATLSASGVTVKAYDNMTIFNKPFAGSIEDVYPYDVFSMACTACGVTLATTRADIEAMANGTAQVRLTGSVETWRDVIGWMAQALGANATIDRSGYLRIFQYGSTSVATYDDAHRHSGASFADFVTRYTGISLTISATNTTYYYHDTPDDALTMELGANPFLQIGSDNDRQTACENILTDLQAVQYSPFDVNLTGCPIYDLGDILTFEDGILSAQKTGCVTYFNYVNHAAYNIKGGGKNPAEAASKSRIDKVVESLSNTVAERVNQISVVQNAAAANIADGSEASVLVYNFEVKEDDNLTLIDVSIAMTSSATETVSGEVYTLDDIVARLHFYVDGSEVSVYDPRFIVDEGKDTMTFNYSLSGLSVGAHEFDIRIEMAGGAGSVAVGDVHEMLWGYGITFEVYVKSLMVAKMPNRTVFYAGETLDYTGLEVDGIYNTGKTIDISDAVDCVPAEGATVEDEPGQLTVEVLYTEGDDELRDEFTLDVLRWVETDFLINGLQRNYDDGTSSLLLYERTNANLVNEVLLDFENRTGELSATAEMVCSQPTGVNPGVLKAKVGEYDVVLVHEQPSPANLNSVAIFREGALISRQYYIEDINGTPADIFYRDGSGWSVSYSYFGSFSVVRFNPTYNSVILKTLGGSTIGTYNALWLTIENNKLHIVAGPDLPQYVVSTNYGNHNLYHTGSEAGYITADIATHTLVKSQTNTINNTTNGGSTRKEYVVFNSSGYYYVWNNETVQYVYVGRKAQNMIGVPTYNYALGKYVRVDSIGFYVATHKVQVDLILYDTLETQGVSTRIVLEVDDLYNLNPTVGSMYFWNGDRLVVGCPVQSPGGVQGVRYYAYDFETETYQKQSFDTEV